MNEGKKLYIIIMSICFQSYNFIKNAIFMSKEGSNSERKWKKMKLSKTGGGKGSKLEENGQEIEVKFLFTFFILSILLSLSLSSLDNTCQHKWIFVD